MALTEGNKMLASDITALKARVKAEMLRRNQTGSIATYGSSSYDFSSSASSGAPIKVEHQTKTIGLIDKIKNTGIAAATNGSIAKAINTASTLLATYEGTPMTSGTSDCASSCTGLCYTNCTGSCKSGCTSCSGCSGSCSGGCEGCTATCANGCQGSNCQGGCENSCIGSCSGGCTGSCTRSCQPTCAAGAGLN